MSSPPAQSLFSDVVQSLLEDVSGLTLTQELENLLDVGTTTSTSSGSSGAIIPPSPKRRKLCLCINLETGEEGLVYETRVADTLLDESLVADTLPDETHAAASDSPSPVETVPDDSSWATTVLDTQSPVEAVRDDSSMATTVSDSQSPVEAAPDDSSRANSVLDSQSPVDADTVPDESIHVNADCTSPAKLAASVVLLHQPSTMEVLERVAPLCASLTGIWDAEAVGPTSDAQVFKHLKRTLPRPTNNQPSPVDQETSEIRSDWRTKEAKFRDDVAEFLRVLSIENRFSWNLDDDWLDTHYLRNAPTNFEPALRSAVGFIEEARSVCNSFTIGITEHPVRRYASKKNNGYKWLAKESGMMCTMHLLYAAPTSEWRVTEWDSDELKHEKETSTGAMERALLAVFRFTPKCTNKGPGGEGNSKGTPHFTYFVEMSNR